MIEICINVALIYFICAFIRGLWTITLNERLCNYACEELWSTRSGQGGSWYHSFNPLSVIINPLFWIHWSPRWYRDYLKKREEKL
jgi:hypothetical protein